VRVAVLADVHGNLPALRAVLADVDRAPVDALVVAGDVVAGPLVRESLELVAGRPEPVWWVRGNSERVAVAAYDGGDVPPGPPGVAARWSARALDPHWRDRLASWPIALELDGVVYCHGSPRRDDEILTTASPTSAFAEALSGIDASLVVGGHTHRQFTRTVPGGVTYANAGSVGLPYEGRPGAFWMTVEDGRPELRETAYDLPTAVEELLAAGLEGYEEQLERSLLDPADPDWVAGFLERSADRRP
jgi:predicted phosphodiesterase